MQLSDEAIIEFQDLYERNFGIRLSDADATAEANNLIAIVNAIQPAELNMQEHLSYNE